MPSRALSEERGLGARSRRAKQIRILAAAAALVVVFAAIYELFLRFLGPPGVVLFAYPSGNITGTTTITTSYGYVCTASPSGMYCSPEFFGNLHVPVMVSLVPLAGFAALCALVFYLLVRRSQAPAEAQ